MLWYKGWLETRWRLLFGMGFVVFYLAMITFTRLRAQPPAPPPFPAMPFLITLWTAATIAPALLGAAGIFTQIGFRPVRGQHGSTQFTLSLPVSRSQLLATRASLGWLLLMFQLVVTAAVSWTIFPPLRALTSPGEMAESLVVLLVGSTGIYAIAVLFSTFVDDAGRAWATMATTAVLAGLHELLPVPATWNIFRAATTASPAVAHTIAWPAICLWLALIAALLAASYRIVKTREY